MTDELITMPVTITHIKTMREAIRWFREHGIPYKRLERKFRYTMLTIGPMTTGQAVLFKLRWL